jgi:uncharacterized protein YjbI with pentapeptide repeats
MTEELNKKAVELLQADKVGEFNELRKNNPNLQLDLMFVNLKKANLKKVNFANANLWGAKFQEADLQEANFTNANLWGANLEKANLYKANLENASLVEGNLENTCLDEANLSCVNFDNIKFFGVTMLDARLKYAAFPPEFRQYIPKALGIGFINRGNDDD